MTLSERLKQLRKERHMTQADLANVLGVAKGTVAMWEMGKRNPSFEALEQLSIVFDRTMSYILGESDDPSSPELGENEIQKLGLWSLEEDYMEIMMNDRERIGKKLAEIRSEKGYTVRQLAELADLRPATISNVENGKFSVGIDILTKICNTLGARIEIVKE